MNLFSLVTRKVNTSKDTDTVHKSGIQQEIAVSCPKKKEKEPTNTLDCMLNCIQIAMHACKKQNKPLPPKITAP